MSDPIAAASKLRTALNRSRKGYEDSCASAKQRHLKRGAELIAEASDDVIQIVRSDSDCAKLLEEIDAAAKSDELAPAQSEAKPKAKPSASEKPKK